MKQSFRFNTLSSLCLGIFLTLSANPASADPPPQEMGIYLGYKYAIPLLPKKNFPRAPRDKWYNPAPSSTGSGKEAEEAREFLTPRLYQKPESTTLIPMLLKLFQKQPDSAKIARKLALTCLQGGQPREALYWFTKTFQLDRSDVSALWNMATLAYRLGEFQKAYAFLGEYARIDPYSAWGRIARNFQKTGKYGGYELSSAFSKNMPKTGSVEPGGGGSGESLMIIDGRATTLEEIAPPYQPVPMIPSLQTPGPGSIPPVKTEKPRSSMVAPSRPSINRAEIEPATPAPATKKAEKAPAPKAAAPAMAVAPPEPPPASPPPISPAPAPTAAAASATAPAK